MDKGFEEYLGAQQKYNEAYPAGKEQQVVRNKKYLDENGKVDWNKWAPGDGRVAESIMENQTLEVGTVIDRYGSVYGKYTSPLGTAYESRALPYKENNCVYHAYRVIKKIDGVTTSEIAAAFDMPGGGIQYELPKNINDLIKEGYLEVIV